MDEPQGTKDLEYLWTSNPLDSDAMIKEWPPLPISLAGVVEEELRYIRDVNLKNGVIIQLVTTPSLKRGYIVRGVDDYLLCDIDSHASHATLTFIGLYRTMKEADAWIADASE